MEQVYAIFEQWLQAVNQGDLQTLLGLYDSQAVLIPTFSERPLSTPAELKRYFESLAQREGLRIVFEPQTLIIQPIHASIFILSGVYEWRFLVEGKEQRLKARFSYVVDPSRPAPILHHHSSQVPNA